MDKKQAQALIGELFTKPFNQERYQHFLRNLLNNFEPRDGHYTGNYIPDAFKRHVNQYWRIGKYVDPEGSELDLLVVEVKTISKLERARSTLRNFAVDRLKKFEKSASLIAFYAQDDRGEDWRFSFVKIDHEAYQDGKGKVKLKQELTPARRYSYLVGVHENSHTASRQLLPVLAMDYADPRLEEIEAAFSIEKVTGEFFDQYKSLFQKLAEHLKAQSYFRQGSEDETVQAVSRFAKKLLGQIVFLYFLQKKGWLGVPKDGRWGGGVKRFMRERYNQTAEAGGDYYHDFLQFLFYEALANERKDQPDPGYYHRFTCRVPFLNGGLFEAEYDWRNESIDLPNSLFHNQEKTAAGDIGTGILDVFDRYNFTIKEDEPLDKDVAVDPEMLGKVFENMLEVKDRKSKGAFYTPREIVHYMCQESLINYLHTELQSVRAAERAGKNTLFEPAGDDDLVPREELDTLIRKGHLFVEHDEAALHAMQRIEQGEQKSTKHKVELPESIKNNAKLLDGKLAAIKVCDPAIGSGAFPVGMLHEIVTARLALAPHSGNHQSSYHLKRHAIAESIYGVDIDPSAIDIARLRLWLSLIVDEDDYDTIEALPNLDYKIMQGNSLVEEYWGVKLFNEEFIQADDRNEAKIEQLKERRRAMDAEQRALHETKQLTKERQRDFAKAVKDLEKTIKNLRDSKAKPLSPGLFDVVSEAKRKAGQLEQLHKSFFSASSPPKKQEIRRRISDLEWELIEATLTERNQLDSLEKVAQIKQGKEKPFFLWKLNFSEVFKQKGGFDVVIGNPPYVQIQNFSGRQIQKDWEAQQYETFAKTGDIYCLFYEKGHRLLRDDGTLCFITSNKWMRAAYGEKLRRFFSEKTQPLTLIDFSSFQVFETATVDTNVLLFRKSKGIRGVSACLIDPTFTRAMPLEAFVARKSIEMNDLSGESWAISNKAGYKIKKQIEGIGTPLKEWDVSIYRGVLTGFNEAFIIDGRKKDELIAADRKCAEIIKPLLRGRDIKRFRVDFADLWLINTHNGYGTVPAVDVTEYSSIKQHLESVEAKRAAGELGEKAQRAKGLYSREDQGETPYNLRNCAYIPEFDKEKITWGNLALSCQFALAGPGLYINNPSPLIGGGNRFLLAVLNSKVADYYIRSLGVTRNGGYFEYKPMFVENLPVPQIDAARRKPFETLANYVLLTTEMEQKLQSAYFEQLIDGLVYELYFPEEIKAAGKEILPHLGELTPVSEDMSEEEKLAVIQRELDRLYDPRHPVRNHLETLDSVEVVKTIREALKR